MKSYKDDSGEFISSPFNRLPPKRTHADYYKLISDPIDLTIIQRKVRGDDYKSFDEFQAWIIIIFGFNKFYKILIKIFAKSYKRQTLSYSLITRKNITTVMIKNISTHAPSGQFLRKLWQKWITKKGIEIY